VPFYLNHSIPNRNVRYWDDTVVGGKIEKTWFNQTIKIPGKKHQSRIILKE